MRPRRASILLSLALVALSPWAKSSHAATPEAPPDYAPDELSVHVLTFGPGDHPFFKFGHNAIWIQHAGGAGYVYNFGTFAFDTPNLIGKFLQGRFKYWLSRATIADTLWTYQASDRTILVQTLDLTPEQARALEQRLEDNARPANREYLYDYFVDNCSTRVRDAIDAAVGGRVRASAQGPGRLTYRGQSLRLVHDVLWEYVGLDLLLGAHVDEPIREWDEDFIPEVFAATLRKVQLERDGGVRPLVRDERALYTSTVPPPPRDPPLWVPWFALVGFAIAAALGVLGLASARNRGARAAFGALLGIVGLVSGVVGLVIPLLWGFTNHRAAHLNWNLLVCPPWTIAFVVIGVAIAVTRRPARWLRAAALLAAISAASATLGLLLKTLPFVHQSNGNALALLLPIWASLAVMLLRARRRAP